MTLRSVPYGQQGYPFAVQVDVTYRLDAESGLHVSVSAANKGSRPAPWGTGQHPYLTVATPTVDDCELTLPAARWLPVDERGIPSGAAQDVAGTEFDFRAARKLGDTRLDHAFTGLHREQDGLAWVRLSAGGARMALWADEGYRWLQVFTGDPLEPEHRRTALAVEPMTCPPNAFVSGEDLLVLQPRETVSCRWGIRIFSAERPVAALRTRARSSGVSTSSGLPVSPHSTSVTSSGCARRNGRAPVSPAASSVTAAQCSRAMSTGLRGFPA